MNTVKFKHYPASNSFNNLMDDFFPHFPSLFRDGNGNNFNHQSVPVNIEEQEQGYQVEIVAPGFSKEDFKINLEKNLLTISSDKKTEEESKKYVRREYKYRSFQRSFTLNEQIDTDSIEAKYENGVLTLNLKYKAEVKAPTKQIEVQ